MVRLWRGPLPPVLREHRREWTKRWREMRAEHRSGNWAIPGARKLLADELRKLAFGKCAFCESLLEVASFLEIEHYVAKTVSPGQAFQWTNLFPICARCNSAKGSADHEGMAIKPDAEDPAALLWLHPGTGELEPRAGLDQRECKRVERTLELCDLQRGALCTKRVETMEATIRWLERLKRVGGCLDDQLREEWRRLVDPATEYKFVIRHVFEIRGAPELAAKDRANFK